MSEPNNGVKSKDLSPGWQRLIVSLVGAVFAGLGALYFAVVERQASGLFDALWQSAPWVLFLLMPAGLCLILYLRDNYFVGTDGTGIPQTIAALKMPDGPERENLLSLRVAVGKLLLTTLGLLSFLSIGREGPSVQLGACFMNFARRFARFPVEIAQRGLILGGGAAGIAAAFNAPLAGIVFSFEEIGRSFEKENLGLLVRTVVTACVVCMVYLGDYFFYGRLDQGLTYPLEFLRVGPWIGVLLVGVIGGFLGGGFSTLLLKLMPVVSRAIRRCFWAIAIPFGLACAGLAFMSDGLTVGSGYLEARALVLEGSPEYVATLPLAEQETLASTREKITWTYPIERAVASFLALLTGIPGGLFDPSFSVGAALGKILMPLFMWTGAPPHAVVLLFIVAYFTGVVQSPLTSVIILIEMTGCVAFTLPLAAAAVIAYEASRRICPVALYEALAENFLKRTENPVKE